MFDHEFVKVLQLGYWFVQHAYVLLVVPFAVFVGALTDKRGDK